MELLTIQQLDSWMTVNCYNDSYGIGNRNIHEGYGLEATDNGYVWYYTERGERNYLQHFQSEAEAVAVAFRAITNDPTANRHLIGFLSDTGSIQELVAELERRGISFWQDKIPLGGPLNSCVRVFVFGCDIQKVLDLQEQYGLDKWLARQ